MSEMNVSLTPELEKIVADRVASGRYASATDVVAEALRLLDEHDRARTSPLSAKELLNPLKQSGFIGMWKDRPDIEDNIDFARRLRIDAERRSRYS
jgi:putative addiction module CopG family antidote